MSELEALAAKYGVDMPNVTTAYRVDLIRGDSIVSPFGDAGGHAGTFVSSIYAPDKPPPECQDESDHVPPVLGCTCGVYAVTDVRELHTILKMQEFGIAAEAMNLRPVVHEKHQWLLKPTEGRGHDQRICITTGTLVGPVDHPANTERLIAFYDDGTDSLTETPTQRAFRRSGMASKGVYGMAVTGDPPSTVRGSLFIRESMVVQLQPFDNPDAVKLDIPTSFVIGEESEHLLSSVLKRYTRSPREGLGWWEH